MGPTQARYFGLVVFLAVLVQLATAVLKWEHHFDDAESIMNNAYPFDLFLREYDYDSDLYRGMGEFFFKAPGGSSVIGTQGGTPDHGVSEPQGAGLHMDPTSFFLKEDMSRGTIVVRLIINFPGIFHPDPEPGIHSYPIVTLFGQQWDDDAAPELSRSFGGIGAYIGSTNEGGNGLIFTLNFEDGTFASCEIPEWGTWSEWGIDSKIMEVAFTWDTTGLVNVPGEPSIAAIWVDGTIVTTIGLSGNEDKVIKLRKVGEDYVCVLCHKGWEIASQEIWGGRLDESMLWFDYMLSADEALDCSVSRCQPWATPVAAPVAAPVNAPTVAPDAPPVAAPVAVPVDPPVAAPAAEPIAPPVQAPTAAPVTAPVAAPIAPPVTAPTDAPVAAPVQTPLATPTAVPTQAPVSPPTSPPGSAPIAAPVSPPVQAPVAAPTTSPSTSQPQAPAPIACSGAPPDGSWYCDNGQYKLNFTQGDPVVLTNVTIPENTQVSIPAGSNVTIEGLNLGGGSTVSFQPNSTVTVSGNIGVGNGATVQVSSGASIEINGTVSVSSGGTIVTQQATTVTINGNLELGDGTGVSFAGGSNVTIGGDVVLSGETHFTVDDATVVTVNGNLDSNSGTYTISQTAQLNVNGNVSLGGELVFSADPLGVTSGQPLFHVQNGCFDLKNATLTFTAPTLTAGQTQAINVAQYSCKGPDSTSSINLINPNAESCSKPKAQSDYSPTQLTVLFSTDDSDCDSNVGGPGAEVLVAAIVGGVIGAAAVAGAVIIIIWVVKRRQMANSARNNVRATLGSSENPL